MSGRPGRLLSVIEVITFREKMPRPLVAHGRAVKNLTILGGCPGCFGSLLVRTPVLLFLSCQSSIMVGKREPE